MKKSLLLTLIFLISLISILSINQKNKNNINKTLSAEQENIDVKLQNSEENIIKLSEEDFSYQYKIIDNTDKLILKSNLEDKLTSTEIYVKYNCSFLINGGFYSEDYKNLGLFTSDYKTLNKQVQSSLFNGFLTINDFETPRISSNLPKDQLRIALQTGPMIMENTYTFDIKTQNEKSSRRMIAAVNGDNKLIFLTVYKKDSVFIGPKLSDLDEAIVEINKVENLNIADSVNLDGGSASAFIDKDTNLREISTIGSFFCLQ